LGSSSGASVAAPALSRAGSADAASLLLSARGAASAGTGAAAVAGNRFNRPSYMVWMDQLSATLRQAR
jgi:hypothetical protein